MYIWISWNQVTEVHVNKVKCIEFIDHINRLSAVDQGTRITMHLHL